MGLHSHNHLQPSNGPQPFGSLMQLFAQQLQPAVDHLRA